MITQCLLDVSRICNIQKNYNNDLLTTPNSEWKLEPEKGLLLRKVTLDDLGSYECLAFNESKGIPFRIVVSGNDFTISKNIFKGLHNNCFKTNVTTHF